MNGKQRFLNACRLQPVDRAPIWIMRQAGRYLPEYRNLREGHSFKDFCRRPDLAREVALQPLRRFKLDAAILFSDILVVPEAMGQSVEFLEGGPQVTPKLESERDLATLKEPDIARDLGYVGDALEAIRDGIGPDTALIGFAGAPYTLANYMVGGQSTKKVSAVRVQALKNPAFIGKLLDTLSDVLIDYLRMQVTRGADALQLFDTWAGELSPDLFADMIVPRIRRITDALADSGVPLIYYVNGAAGLLSHLGETGAQVIGVDWRVSLKEARERLGSGVALQGNLDPLTLYAPPERIRSEARRMLAETGGQGHIVNLGHGVYPDTPIEGVEAFVDEITNGGGAA